MLYEEVSLGAKGRNAVQLLLQNVSEGIKMPLFLLSARVKLHEVNGILRKREKIILKWLFLVNLFQFHY
jgi:hypothetical protein